jgi:hypothetical protein
VVLLASDTEHDRCNAKLTRNVHLRDADTQHVVCTIEIMAVINEFICFAYTGTSWFKIVRIVACFSDFAFVAAAVRLANFAEFLIILYSMHHYLINNQYCHYWLPR